MDDIRLDRQFRALRQHRGWRQDDAAAAAGLSQPTASRVERGRVDQVPLRRLRELGRVLEAELVIALRWRAGELDRLVDERHAEAVGLVAAWLRRRGWEVRAEVTYAIYGERGAIDLLAWHAATRTLLVVEVKTELVSVEETLRRHDAKVRLGPRVAADRFGWCPNRVARLLTLPDTTSSRRRVQRHAAVLDGACPHRGQTVRDWARSPGDPMAGLLFVNSGRRRGASRKRIRRRPGQVG